MDYKKFLLKLSIFVIPFLLIVFLYVFTDPFKTIYKYPSYYKSNSVQGVILNRDFVSTETFKNTYPYYNYNSFILGNSRSIFFRKETWRKYLTPNSEIFHFDASGESLFGIESKLRYLEKNGIPIDNLLLIIDQSVLKNTADSKGFLLMKHYELSGKNRFSFEIEFFKAFLNFKFISAYIYYKITNKVEPYMTQMSILDDRPINYDIRGNQISFDKIDSIIKKSPEKYYTKERMKVFYSRDTSLNYGMPVISSLSEEMLVNIYKILKKKNTKYKIVISPLYDQVGLNPNDLKILNHIFKKENVFDFSGINHFTNDYRNYYESSHYRPNISDEIMTIIYK